MGKFKHPSLLRNKSENVGNSLAEWSRTQKKEGDIPELWAMNFPLIFSEVSCNTGSSSINDSVRSLVQVSSLWAAVTTVWICWRAFLAMSLKEL